MRARALNLRRIAETLGPAAGHRHTVLTVTTLNKLVNDYPRASRLSIQRLLHAALDE